MRRLVASLPCVSVYSCYKIAVDCNASVCFGFEKKKKYNIIYKPKNMLSLHIAQYFIYSENMLSFLNNEHQNDRNKQSVFVVTDQLPS